MFLQLRAVARGRMFPIFDLFELSAVQKWSDTEGVFFLIKN